MLQVHQPRPLCSAQRPARWKDDNFSVLLSSKRCYCREKGSNLVSSQSSNFSSVKSIRPSARNCKMPGILQKDRKGTGLHHVERAKFRRVAALSPVKEREREGVSATVQSCQARQWHTGQPSRSRNGDLHSNGKGSWSASKYKMGAELLATNMTVYDNVCGLWGYAVAGTSAQCCIECKLVANGSSDRVPGGRLLGSCALRSGPPGSPAGGRPALRDCCRNSPLCRLTLEAQLRQL